MLVVLISLLLLLDKDGLVYFGEPDSTGYGLQSSEWHFWKWFEGCNNNVDLEEYGHVFVNSLKNIALCFKLFGKMPIHDLLN